MKSMCQSPRQDCTDSSSESSRLDRPRFWVPERLSLAQALHLISLPGMRIGPAHVEHEPSSMSLLESQMAHVCVTPLKLLETSLGAGCRLSTYPELGRLIAGLICVTICCPAFVRGQPRSSAAKRKGTGLDASWMGPRDVRYACAPMDMLERHTTHTKDLGAGCLGVGAVHALKLGQLVHGLTHVIYGPPNVYHGSAELEVTSRIHGRHT